jgi:transcriptional regulator with XRE-family HTH domain
MGARIRQQRIIKDITQDDLAKSIGKLRPVIQRIEGGGVNPTIYTLREIAGGLDITLDKLLEGVK